MVLGGKGELMDMWHEGLKFCKKLYSGVGHGAIFLLVLMALCGVLFGTTLHVVNVPPTLVNALVYFV